MAFEEKYQTTSASYIASVIKRKLLRGLYSYPEFMFLLKFLVLVVVAFLVFTIFRKSFGL